VGTVRARRKIASVFSWESATEAITGVLERRIDGRIDDGEGLDK